MSNENESGGAVFALIGLGMAIGLAYLSQNPIWDIAPFFFLAGTILVTGVVGAGVGESEVGPLKTKLSQMTVERNAFEKKYKSSEAELDKIMLEIEEFEEKYDEVVADGIKEGKSAALKTAITERDELQSQINSLANQLENSTKATQKLEAGGQKKQKDLQKKVDFLETQISHEQKQAEERFAKLEEEHTTTLQVLSDERSRTETLIADRISEMPHDDIIDFINARLKIIRRAEMTGDAQSALIKLQSQIQSVFTSNGLVDVNTLIEFDDNIFRINEYEAIIDLYMEKIKTVRQKSDIDEEDREEQIVSWRRLMDQEVAKMEGTA